MMARSLKRKAIIFALAPIILAAFAFWDAHSYNALTFEAKSKSTFLGFRLPFTAEEVSKTNSYLAFGVKDANAYSARMLNSAWVAYARRPIFLRLLNLNHNAHGDIRVVRYLTANPHYFKEISREPDYIRVFLAVKFGKSIMDRKDYSEAISELENIYMAVQSASHEGMGREF